MRPALFIDIETIPGQKDGLKDLLAKKITHPANMSKPETIEAWEKDKKPAAVDEAWRKTAFDGSFGEIISVAWAFDDGPIQTLHRELGEKEHALIAGVLASIQKQADRRAPIWVGHNITGFDLRFLWQRCVVHGVKPPITIPFDAKPWSDQVFDTLVEWKGLAKAGGTMDEVCFALGLDGKGEGLDGSQIWEAVQAGRYQEIVDYNKQDVERTRAMYYRMTFNDTKLREVA